MLLLLGDVGEDDSKKAIVDACPIKTVAHSELQKESGSKFTIYRNYPIYS